MFFFKKKDPICGMKEDGKGIKKHGEWFCSVICLNKYEKGIESNKHGCCH